MKRKRGMLCVIAAFALLMFASGLHAQGGFEITSVVRSGDDAPVPPELVVAFSPSLNDKGQVAFTGDGAVFLESEGKQMMIAGFGDPAPGGGTFITASSP